MKYRHFLAVVLGLLVAGCAPKSLDSPNPSPDAKPIPPATALEQAAEQSGTLYLKSLSTIADSTATAIEHGELKDYPAVFDQYQVKSKAAREAAMKGYEQALSDQLKPERGNFNPVDSAKSFREISSGFKRAAGAN